LERFGCYILLSIRKVGKYIQRKDTDRNAAGERGIEKLTIRSGPPLTTEFGFQRHRGDRMMSLRP
jgi:hypothetical protein